MENEKKIIIGLVVLVLAISHLIAFSVGGRWKRCPYASTKVETYTDTVVAYVPKHTHRVDTITKTVRVTDRVITPYYIDTNCPPDTTHTYVLYGGDSIVRTTDSVRVTGTLHWRAQVLDYNLPTRTITNTERVTTTYEVASHRLYMTANTNLVPGIMYANRYFTAGYQYDLRTRAHTGTLGVLLFSRGIKK